MWCEATIQTIQSFIDTCPEATLQILRPASSQSLVIILFFSFFQSKACFFSLQENYVAVLSTCWFQTEVCVWGVSRKWLTGDPCKTQTHTPEDKHCIPNWLPQPCNTPGTKVMDETMILKKIMFYIFFRSFEEYLKTKSKGYKKNDQNTLGERKELCECKEIDPVHTPSRYYCWRSWSSFFPPPFPRTLHRCSSLLREGLLSCP